MYLGNRRVTEEICKSSVLVSNEMRLFAEVGASEQADLDFWKTKKKCDRKGIVDASVLMKIKMGTVVDYFRPNMRMPLCDFLTSRRNYEWAPSVCGPFLKPPAAWENMGGSAHGWPATAITGDLRNTLSFWGSSNSSNQGGCCCTDYTCAGDSGPKWGLNFDLYLGLYEHAAKPCNKQMKIGKLQLFAEFSPQSDTTARAWYTLGCAEHGLVDKNVVMEVAMGVTKDYFRPIEEMSLCTFIMSSSKFEWKKHKCSTWLIPQHAHQHHKVELRQFGGSKKHWVKKHVEDDKRSQLSVWGSGRSNQGGCCCKDYDCLEPDWHQEFSVSFAKDSELGCDRFYKANQWFKWATVAENDDTRRPSWYNRGCEEIGMVRSTVTMRMTMGKITDYFRPVQLMTFCKFLLNPHSFQFKSTLCGEWETPAYTHSAVLGSSKPHWPRTIPGDQRPYLSSWGDTQKPNAGGCCCVDYECKHDRMNRAFTLELADEHVATKICRTDGLVESGIQMFANIKPNQGTTLLDWSLRGCEKKGLIDDNTIVEVIMGKVHDYFKPKVQMSWCAFLTARENFLWSPDRCHDFTEPLRSDKFHGGSAYDWPRKTVVGDNRPYLSFWGSGSSKNSGCCCVDYTCAEKSWNLGFQIGLGRAENVTKECGKVDIMTGGFQLWKQIGAKDNTTFHSWNHRGCEKIGTIGPTTFMMKIKMGSVTDYYLPKETMTFCDLLQSTNRFFWTRDLCGAWKLPDYSPKPAHFGGSAPDWPSTVNATDRRFFLPFWGREKPKSGGCCCVDLNCRKPRWGKAFDIHIGNPAVIRSKCGGENPSEEEEEEG